MKTILAMWTVMALVCFYKPFLSFCLDLYETRVNTGAPDGANKKLHFFFLFIMSIEVVTLVHDTLRDIGQSLIIILVIVIILITNYW